MGASHEGIHHGLDGRALASAHAHQRDGRLRRAERFGEAVQVKQT
jgi:hypothetical protein